MARIALLPTNVLLALNLQSFVGLCSVLITNRLGDRHALSGRRCGEMAAAGAVAAEVTYTAAAKKG
jgi:hypothetical protein